MMAVKIMMRREHFLVIERTVGEAGLAGDILTRLVTDCGVLVIWPAPAGSAGGSHVESGGPGLYQVTN